MGHTSGKEFECYGPIVAVSNCVDGLYLESSLCVMQISCLVDTGANISILHTKKYFAILAGVRLPLVPSESHIRIANGDKIPALGQTPLTLDFPGIGAISHPVIVFLPSYFIFIGIYILHTMAIHLTLILLFNVYIIFYIYILLCSCFASFINVTSILAILQYTICV